MFFTKQALLFSSLLVGALVSAAPLPMPLANAVSNMQLRDVELIPAYEKRQVQPDPTLDIVTIKDDAPVQALDGVVKTYPRRQVDGGIVTFGDSAPMQAPDGVLKSYPRQVAADDSVVNVSDSVPMQAPDGVLKNYPRQADGVVTIGDSTPMKAPDGVLVSYPRNVAPASRMRRTRSTRSHA